MGLEGIIRGKADPHHGERQGGAMALSITLIASFHASAPNMLWVSDFTYVATPGPAFVYVAFGHRQPMPAGSSAGG